MAWEKCRTWGPWTISFCPEPEARTSLGEESLCQAFPPSLHIPFLKIRAGVKGLHSEDKKGQSRRVPGRRAYGGSRGEASASSSQFFSWPTVCVSVCNTGQGRGHKDQFIL